LRLNRTSIVFSLLLILPSALPRAYVCLIIPFLREGGAWLGDDHGGDCLSPPRMGNAEDDRFGCE
jgi:hypothetical protein